MSCQTIEFQINNFKSSSQYFAKDIVIFFWGGGYTLVWTTSILSRLKCRGWKVRNPTWCFGGVAVKGRRAVRFGSAGGGGVVLSHRA